MDVEFIVQDAYMLTRPQWKLVTNLEEASQVFGEAVKLNYQSSASGKPAEAEEDEASASEDDGDGPDDEDLAMPEGDDEKSSGEDADVGVPSKVKNSLQVLTFEPQGSGDDEPTVRIMSDDEDEQIVVTRQEDERDPEADAEFDRELAKMMTESAESRKFERKPVFDVPLPMRRAREAAINPEDSGGEAVPAQAPAIVSSRADFVPTMKFSLLSKRGNKQQTRSIDLPSDSTFAVAMRSKQQAEKEEQQRIKNLVLNYELRDDNDAEGEFPFSSYLHPNPNRKKRTETTEGLDKTHNPYAQPRLDKAGNNRSHQRARKLQLSDVNWYDASSSTQFPRLPSQQTSSDATPNGGAVHSLVIPIQKKSFRKVK